MDELDPSTQVDRPFGWKVMHFDGGASSWGMLLDVLFWIRD